ncbi:hypothetical protein LALCM10_170064 [Dellaglioa algida]|nr:hypothetical protein LALCM10_170064 [Dellaglioa algida]
MFSIKLGGTTARVVPDTIFNIVSGTFFVQKRGNKNAKYKLE